MTQLLVFILGIFLLSPGLYADVQLSKGKESIQKLGGCYLVDYSYSETQSLSPSYQLDSRVYDVNRDKSVKEWIYVDEITPTRLRVQHVLFAVDLSGKLMEGSLLKHTGEDWEYNAPFLYEFTSPLHWVVKDLSAEKGKWTRRITNLDDGLRYQCSAEWNLSGAYPEWACNNNFSPIPGRETRDMGRKDYNTLLRNTRIILYPNNWLERQDNVKTIYDVAQGTRTPLVRELGKNWYMKLPDSECSAAKAFTNDYKSFWDLTREAWDEVLIGDRDFTEKIIPGKLSRYFEFIKLEENYIEEDLTQPQIRQKAKNSILKVIGDYRE